MVLMELSHTEALIFVFVFVVKVNNTAPLLDDIHVHAIKSYRSIQIVFCCTFNLHFRAVTRHSGPMAI